MSEFIENPAAGHNGGFEDHVDGMPTQWQLYTPATVPNSDFDLILDESEANEGRYSLHFNIRTCKRSGGWGSPGLAKEWFQPAGSRFRLRFQVKAIDCEWNARVGGVAPKEGEWQPLNVASADGDWQGYQFDLQQPPQFSTARFELSILSPGKFWIDGFQVEVLNPTAYTQVRPDS